ncbi:hypothetical protein L596_003129 [Steinernema carpocapsae]|uniref:MAM domain-containing protein n=1 Tax=Steinernema carpocapsae TaxID=34508 RepID=A0A4U8US90_STECR|nr:hypothetical protein L596_003129 [Steinernema carpocapsae]
MGTTLGLINDANANLRLNCDFESECCWHSPDQSWTLNPQVDLSWFRRTFRGIGRKSVPASSYVSKSVMGREASPQAWESCEFCSSTGVVDLDFRHWQSPTATVKICWTAAINQSSFKEDQCESVHNSQTVELYVPKNTPVKIGFVLTNRGARSQAVVVIDKIHVQTEFCSLNVRHLPIVVVHKQPKMIPIVNNSQLPTTVFSAPSTTTQIPFTLPTLFPALNLTIPPMFSISPGPLVDVLRSLPRLQSLPSFSVPTAKQVPTMGAPQKIVIQKRTEPTSAIKERVTPAPSLNPFTDMFGKEFADFLRPDFDSTKADENTISGEDEEGVPFTQLETKGDVCNTVGGCLFDHGMCGYRNSKTLSNKGNFVRGMSGKSVFVETRLEPGEVAVLETRTKMTEPHVILFDWLEFTEGEKLSACCYTPGRTPQDLVCPMESPSHMTTDIAWKAGRIDCPTNTTKIMFICENYGRVDGVCALDTIRLFKQSDLAMQFPCQHSVFAQKQL